MISLQRLSLEDVDKMLRRRHRDILFQDCIIGIAFVYLISYSMFIRKIILLIMNIIMKTRSSVGTNYVFTENFRDPCTPLSDIVAKGNLLGR